MKKREMMVGALFATTTILFCVGLFLIGSQHKAFSKRSNFYAEFVNVDGIGEGAKVRVNGMDAGQVQSVFVPPTPARKFRLEMTVDDRLRGLVRSDSIVSVETEGLVGDKFLLIHTGSDQSPQANSGATLRSKEPFDMTKMLEQANGLLTDVDGTVMDLHSKMDVAFDAVTNTVDNTNGIVADIRGGKGTAGLLLEDAKVAGDVKQIILNGRNATKGMDSTVMQVNDIVGDVQQRQLVPKLDDTLTNARSATQQLLQISQQLNGTLKSALAEDQYGEDAGANLQQSLTNINQATGNLADDTEALKHEFFFKGFFKSRGYDSLDRLPEEKYRSGKLLGKVAQERQWLAAAPLFTASPGGTEVLSGAGRRELDEAVSRMEGLYNGPLIVEGYTSSGTHGEMLVRSRQRAAIVRNYLQTRYHLAPQNTGIIGLSAEPPLASGRTSWNGVCLVHLVAGT